VPNNEIVQVSTTLGDRDKALQMAKTLVEGRLAACVQVVGPVHSCYRWSGEVETEQEWLCLAKTTRAGLAALFEAIGTAHPYDLPEILAVAAEANETYARWVAAEVGAPGA
jgi:periplasmic divalent cation tolerance protein